MYLARYYIDREKWIPAINRFKIVVKDYETTIFVKKLFIDWLNYIIRLV